MKTAKEIISNLERHQPSKPSNFIAKAKEERENRKWIRLSQYIAVLALDKMEELNMTQSKLAELLGCSQQYVSKLLKGKENLSLETICKLEDCLNISFFNSNAYCCAAEPGVPFGKE